MVTVKIQRSTKTESDVEVTFPLYKEADYGGDDYHSNTWYRFDEDGTLWSVKFTEYFGIESSKWEIERERWRGRWSMNVATYWDLTKDLSDAASFEKAKQQALDFIKQIE